MMRRRKIFIPQKHTSCLTEIRNRKNNGSQNCRKNLQQIGLLSKGHFVEVSRTDLIAGYQTDCTQGEKVIEKAKGGVLFIDEAYSITENDHSDSYGRECLTELTKAWRTQRDLVVIVAGYTEPMNKFSSQSRVKI